MVSINHEIDFDKLYQKEKKSYRQKSKDNHLASRPKWFYFLMIALYFILSNMIALIVISVINKAQGKRLFHPTEAAIKEVYTNNNYLAIITPTEKDALYLTPFNKNIHMFTLPEYNIRVLFHKQTKLADFLLLDKDTLDKTNFITILTGVELLEEPTYFYITLTDTEKALLQTQLNIAWFKNKCNIEVVMVTPKIDEALINGIVYLIMLIVIGGLMYKELIYDAKLFIKRPLQHFYYIVGGIILLFIAAYFSHFIALILSKLFQAPLNTSSNQAAIEYMFLTSDSKALMYLSVILCAPIIEELIFRKAFFKLSKNKGLMLYTSSLVFGLIHIIMEKSPVLMVINLPTYMLAGLAFGSIYLLNKENIYVTISVHMIWNTLSILLGG